MARGCRHQRMTLAYPQHRFTPEDLLHFIESTEFSEGWDELGLDDEDDLASLQLCIMAHPAGDRLIEGTNGLRLHTHKLWSANKREVTVYYAYFEDFGIVYLVCVDGHAERNLAFSDEQRAGFRAVLNRVQVELERLQTIRIRARE